jgi:hypothetical protein
LVGEREDKMKEFLKTCGANFVTAVLLGAGFTIGVYAISKFISLV